MTFVAILMTMQVAAICGELLDVRETAVYFHRVDEFADDCREIALRAERLRDAPPVSHAALFGMDTAGASAALVAIRTQREAASRVAALYPHNPLARDAVSRYDRLYATYDAIRDSVTAYYYVPKRREALKKVARIAADFGYDFTRGEFPPPYFLDI